MNKFFILKPTASSCGRGIKVVSGQQKISNREETIASVYIDRPLFIRHLFLKYVSPNIYYTMYYNCASMHYIRA
jgi:hypothetical protein